MGAWSMLLALGLTHNKKSPEIPAWFNQPVTEKLLRQVLREEMPEYVRGQARRSRRPAGKQTTG